MGCGLLSRSHAFHVSDHLVTGGDSLAEGLKQWSGGVSLPSFCLCLPLQEAYSAAQSFQDLRRVKEASGFLEDQTAHVTLVLFCV